MLTLVALLALAGCATGAPLGSLLPGLSHRSRILVPLPRVEMQLRAANSPWATIPDEASTADEDDDPEDDFDEGESAPGAVAGASEAPSRSKASHPVVGGEELLDDRGEGWAGWPDGVGEGRPYAVPFTVDYFQGFLVRAGVPAEALPVDGRTLSPEQALKLLPHLLSTEVTLGNFAQRRMAAQLLRGGGGR